MASAVPPNLKQLALACHSFADVHMGLPPAMIAPGGTNANLPNGLVLVLPFVGHGALYSQQAAPITAWVGAYNTVRSASAFATVPGPCRFPTALSARSTSLCMSVPRRGDHRHHVGPAPGPPARRPQPDRGRGLSYARASTTACGGLDGGTRSVQGAGSGPEHRGISTTPSCGWTSPHLSGIPSSPIVGAQSL
ncbi:DUF1559 family PulG-like putative transporter [Gemmata sp.]|uniref:DUF1559 family PulG-like putative transporter n=1 Tax=Gemmata sp. TaxID=1914242 RepID=UPI003F71D935